MEEKKNWVPAPFNGKDAIPDFDWLFDDGNTTENGRRCVGFIDDMPCLLYWFGNEADICTFDSENLPYVYRKVKELVDSVNKINEKEGFFWHLKCNPDKVMLCTYRDEK